MASNFEPLQGSAFTFCHFTAGFTHGYNYFTYLGVNKLMVSNPNSRDLTREMKQITARFVQ
ncbi:MAG: hypothetical protein EBZ58_00875 [Bacteroidetes bacterium]|nr:hypothetical protein [Bacteroidota bacterium]